MPHDRKAAAKNSFLRVPLLALLAALPTSGHSLAASDTHHRSKPKVHRTQPAPAPAAIQTTPPAPQTTPPAAEEPVLSAPQHPATVTLERSEVSAALGSEVRSAVDENMGRIVDALVDRNGKVRAAIIDFGGFLGVGSRKIAVDWGALRFSPGQERNRVVLEMTREEVKAAPEYQDGKPVVVLTASANPTHITVETPKR